MGTFTGGAREEAPPKVVVFAVLAQWNGGGLVGSEHSQKRNLHLCYIFEHKYIQGKYVVCLLKFPIFSKKSWDSSLLLRSPVMLHSVLRWGGFVKLFFHEN